MTTPRLTGTDRWLLAAASTGDLYLLFDAVYVAGDHDHDPRRLTTAEDDALTDLIGDGLIDARLRITDDGHALLGGRMEVAA